MTVPRAYLGLGSNLGDPARQLADAVRRLAEHVEVKAVSSVYRSEPIGYTDQPDYSNVVIEVETDDSPEELLARAQAVEAALGRSRTFRNAPRTIDVDLLTYDDLVLGGPELELPHPRMRQRGFVLRPLVEIAPDLRDPRDGRPYAEILREGRFEKVERSAPPSSVWPAGAHD